MGDDLLFLTGSITQSKIIYTTNNSKQSKSPTTAKSPIANNKPTSTRWEFRHLIVEASCQKWTNKRLCEALDSNEASEAISAKRYKPRYKLRLEVLHFRGTSFEASVSFVTSLLLGAKHLSMGGGFIYVIFFGATDSPCWSLSCFL